MLILSILLGAASASATTIIPLSLDQLAGKSTTIVRAQATQTWSAWNPQHTVIYTYTKFQVVKSLKGASEQTITVKQIGGRVGNTMQRVSGVRHFTVGEEDVLFLQPSQDYDGTLIVTGLVQGSFQLYRSANGKIMASNGVPEVSAVTVGSGAITTYRGSAMTVDQLESRIRKAVQQ